MAKPRRAQHAHTSHRFDSPRQLDDRTEERQALLDAALAGSADAHGALLVHCRPIMTRFFRKRLPRKLARKAGEDDLIQEASLLAVSRFAEFCGDTVAQYFGWLTAICCSVLCAFARSFKVGSDRDLARELSLDEPCAQLLFGRQPTGEAMLEKSEEAERLRAALAELPDNEREIVTLRHEGGVTFVQIAGRLGRSVDAIKRRHYQLIALLRRRLANEPPWMAIRGAAVSEQNRRSGFPA